MVGQYQLIMGDHHQPQWFINGESWLILVSVGESWSMMVIIMLHKGLMMLNDDEKLLIVGAKKPGIQYVKPIDNN